MKVCIKQNMVKQYSNSPVFRLVVEHWFETTEPIYAYHYTKKQIKYPVHLFVDTVYVVPIFVYPNAMMMTMYSVNKGTKSVSMCHMQSHSA